MILVIATLITIFFATVTLILTRHRLRIYNFGTVDFFVIFFCLIVGVILMLYSSNEISTSLLRQTWPVIKAKVVQTNITGERAYNPEIHCRYEVDGKLYTLSTDLKTPGFGRKRSRRQTAEIILNDYQIGSEVQVKYNPKNPEEAVVRTGPYWSNYMQISVGILLSVLGLYGIVGIIIKKATVV
jgi:ABC-type transport system involved in multi-copper enzyme maturation permease subunit